jgi:hypothetical protein
MFVNLVPTRNIVAAAAECFIVIIGWVGLIRLVFGVFGLFHKVLDWTEHSMTERRLAIQCLF